MPEDAVAKFGENVPMKRPGQPLSSFPEQSAARKQRRWKLRAQRWEASGSPLRPRHLAYDRADAGSGFSPCDHGVVRGRDTGVDIAPVALTKDRVAQMRGQLRLREAGIARLVNDGRGRAKDRERRHQL